MNPTALFAMAGVTVGWIALVGIALYAGLYATATFLVLVAVALHLYVSWARLRASEISGPSLPRRVWLNAAMLAVGFGTCAAFGVALARRMGLL